MNITLTIKKIMRKTKRNRTPKVERKPMGRDLRNFDNDVCKNAIFEQNIYLEKINVGCENLRANGSSHCEECSNNFKQGIPFKRKEVAPEKDKRFIKKPTTGLVLDSELKNEK